MMLKTMICITTNIQQLLKDIVMKIGLLDQLEPNPQVDTFYYRVRNNILEIIQTNMYSSLYNGDYIHRLDKAGEEAELLQIFLEDILFWPKPMASICIHCGSQAAIGR